MKSKPGLPNTVNPEPETGLTTHDTANTYTTRKDALARMQVRSLHGAVHGAFERGAWAFRGIRYAAAPLGERRFAAPQPLDAQAIATLQLPFDATHTARHDALVAGIAPLQNTGIAMGSRPVGVTTEDCLYLDVYTPSSAGKRPVMVWVFGGGFVSGSGTDVLTHGSRLSAHGDVVVVTFNYRLGAFGFLHWPNDAAIASARSTALQPVANAGLLDQIAVLRWVQREIAAFGGDPDCVTVFGESAGAMSVCDLLTSPAAQGLFHRAIAQSGAAESVQTATAAIAVHHDLASALGIAPYDLAALRACDSEELLAAQLQAWQQGRARRGGMGFRPCIDGTVLPEQPLLAIAAGRAARVPLLIGSNLDEQRLYVSARQQLTDAELQVRVSQRLQAAGVAGQWVAGQGVVGQDLAAAAIALYRRAHPNARQFEQPDPNIPERARTQFGNVALLAAIDTDLAFRLPALRVARDRARSASAAAVDASATYLYLWTWPSPALRGWLGACHAIEVSFVFGNLDAPGMKRFAGHGPDADALSADVMAQWTHFAHHGVPADPHWLPYPGTAAEPAAPVLSATCCTRVFNATCTTGQSPDAALLTFWCQAGLL